jgi:tetratricopeptide (TPR) repeat protein
MTSQLVRVVLGAGLAALVMLRGPVGALAQPAPKPAPSAAEKEAAKKLVDDGIAAQNAKDYDKAIDLYQKAFQLIPHPILLYNIGLAHKLAGRPARAVSFFERYLKLEPNGDKAADVRADLAALKAAAAAQPAEPEGPPEPEATVTAPPEPRPDASQPEDPPVKVLVRNDVHRAETGEHPGRSLRIAGLALAGAGLASAALGGYFGLRVGQIEDDARDEIDRALANGDPPPSMEVLQQKYGKDGDAAERNQFIAYGIAGTLVIGGAVTYYLGYRKDRSAPTTALVPVVRPDFAGLAFSGRLR